MERSWAVKFFDEAAMGSYPHIARLLGYTFRVGYSEELLRDARTVLQEVWSAAGITFPQELAWVGEQYDKASVWIVAYHRGKPVGVKGLIDTRRASLALDVMQRQMLPELEGRRVREIARLAILPSHRGGQQTIMVGLLREMLHFCKKEGAEYLLAGSDRRLFRVYQRYNPTACEIHPPHNPKLHPDVVRYFESVRTHSPDPVLYTFRVDGASPWSVFQRFLTRRLRPGKERKHDPSQP